MPAVFFDSEIGKGILMFVGILLVTIGGVAVGGYVLVRLIAAVFNNRRDKWEGAGSELGLAPDGSSGGVVKRLTGARDGRGVTVEFYAVQTGETSTDDYAAVEVPIKASFAFSFEIKRPEMFYQKVAGFFSKDDRIGHEPFDDAFDIESSDRISLIELLNIEMLDGENSNLIGDLMAARKKYHRVKVTDTAICLGVRADIGDSGPIEPTIKKAIYIAERFEKAAGKM